MATEFVTRYGGEEAGHYFNATTSTYERSPHTTISPSIEAPIYHPPSGKFSLGDRAVFRILPRGHKLGPIWLRLKTGKLKYGTLTGDGTATGSSGGTNGFNTTPSTSTGKRLAFYNHLGYHILKRVELVGGQERLYETNGLAMYLDHELNNEEVDKYEKEMHSYRNCTGTQALDEMVTVTNSGLDMLIRINLPHDEKISNYISMNNVSDELYLYVDLAPIQELVFNEGSTVVYDTSGSTENFDITKVNIETLNVELLTHMYKLLPAEAAKYAERAESHTIRHFQFQDNIPVAAGATDVQFNVSSLAPVQTIFIMLTDLSKAKNINGCFGRWSTDIEKLEFDVDGEKDLDPRVWDRKYLKEVHMPAKFVNRKIARESDIIGICYADHDVSEIPTGIHTLGSSGTKKFTLTMKNALASGGKVSIVYRRWNFLEYDGMGRIKVQSI